MEIVGAALSILVSSLISIRIADEFEIDGHLIFVQSNVIDFDHIKAIRMRIQRVSQRQRSQ